MTTNITPIEALEKIKAICKKSKQLTCTNNGCCQVSTCEDIEKVIDQALTLQECDEQNDLDDLLVQQRELLPVEWLNSKSPHALGAVVGSRLDIVHYANKYISELKQLYSQQKTFTLEEVREILEDYYGGNEKGIFPLMHEFKKAVG